MTRTALPRWRRAVRLVAVLGLAAMGSAGAGAAASVIPDDDAAPLAELTTGLSSIVPTVGTFGPTVLSEGRRLSVGIDVVNSSVVAASVAEGLWMEMRLTREPLTTPEDIAQFHDTPGDFSTRQVARTPVGPREGTSTGRLRSGETARVAVGADARDLALPEDAWGVYGVSLYLHDSTDAVLVDAMVTTWMDTELPPLPVSVLATASGSSARMDAILAAADHPAVTVVVDPTAIPHYSDAQRSLLGREVYRLPAHHPDVTSLAHAGDARLLERASQLSVRADSPSLRQLPWLGAVATLDTPTVTMLQENGAVAAVVEPSDVVEPEESGDLGTDDDSRGALPPPVSDAAVPGTSATLPVITPHPGLSRLLSSFRPTHAATPARIVAETALLASAGDGTRGVVLSTGRSWVVGGEGASPTLSALFSAPWVQARPLATALSDAQRGTVDIPEATASAADILPSDLELLGERLRLIERLAGTTADPSALIDPATESILSVVSLHARSDPASRDADIRTVLEQTAATLDSVSIATGSSLNLVAASGDVPITVRNDLPVDTTVTVAMMTSSPYIDVVEAPTITVPAGSETTALVPVTAVSSANVTVSVVLRDESGEPVTQAQELEIRVRADWGNAATGVFTVALVLLLIAGLVRTIRRGRKDTRTGPGPQAARAEPAPLSDHD